MLHNFLSRSLSFLDWTTAMLFWLDFHQTQSNLYRWLRNAEAQLVFSEPKRAHVTPLFISLHWLPVEARIKFKTPMLAYRAVKHFLNNGKILNWNDIAAMQPINKRKCIFLIKENLVRAAFGAWICASIMKSMNTLEVKDVFPQVDCMFPWLAGCWAHDQ